MAKCSLRFYEKSKLKPDKNWCFDSIETYLSTLTYFDVSDFQYQRFEIDKEIRVDFSQSEQTISSSAKKYDYLRISTIVNNAPIYYYYFIVKTRQVSESTIAYQLRMDTLNTFKFSSTAGNGNYTLSPKTLVKREHKDRVDPNKIKSVYYSSSINWNTFVNNLINDLSASAPETGYLSIFWSSLYTYCRTLSSGNRTPSIEGTETDVLVKSGDEFLSYRADKIIFNCLNANYITISLYKNGSSVFSINLTSTSNISFYVKIESGEDYPLKTLTWGTTGNTIGVLFGYVLSPYHVYLKKEYYCRIIDEYQEGLATQLFKKSDNILYDGDEDNQWYMVFASANAVSGSVSSVDYVNPVQIRFYSDKGYSISAVASHEVILYANDDIIPKIKNRAEQLTYTIQTPPTLGEQYVKIAGTTYDFHDYSYISLIRTNNTDIYFSSIHIKKRDNTDVYLTNVESVIFYGINTIRCFKIIQHSSGSVTGSYYCQIDINSGAGSYSGTSVSWSDVDLTDARLIKAFAFPYAPCDFLVGKDEFEELPNGFIFSTDGAIEVDNRTIKYGYQIVFENDIMSELFIETSEFSSLTAQVRNIKYESKLFHSDYYQPKFVYDSFAFTFNFEDIDIEKYAEQFPDDKHLFVTYVVSSNIQSKFMFKFDSYIQKRSIQNYDDVLCIERNNEKALFNNAYINYIRSGGYSYDTKKASSQNAVNGVTTALSIVGSIASFASSAATGGAGIAAGVGLAIGAAAGIIRSVHTAQEQDRAIAQKINQQMIEGTSVQGSEDIDILMAFSENKAKIVEYKLSDIMQTAMWDLFHYCGYATHEQKIPDVTTRLYFNFVQAEIVFESYNFNEEIADDIQNKWNEGVTFFHAVSGAYDIDQQYENFEISLM